MRLVRLALCVLPLAAGSVAASAQDLNVPVPVPELELLLAAEPMHIVAAEISRPKARGDITLKADVSFGGAEPIRVKLRKSVPGAEEFNNVPRYDLAAYELQKLLMDAGDYVVPPTALRMVRLEDFRRYTDQVRPTFKDSDDVLAVLQYWLQEVKVIEDVYDPARFEADPGYARHVGQLNVFTYLIEHRDSNVGNFLISRATTAPRVFSVDNGVAFASGDSDRGELWRRMRVSRIPADTAQRLRSLSEATLTERLAVLAQWELRDGRFVPAAHGANLASRRGVRTRNGVVQLGLTEGEIERIGRRVRELVEDLDAGRLATF